MMMDFEVKRTVSFDVDDFAETVLDFVTNEMWSGYPEDEEHYDCLSETNQSILIATILKIALEKIKNTWQIKNSMI